MTVDGYFDRFTWLKIGLKMQQSACLFNHPVFSTLYDSCRFEGIVIVRNGGSYGAVSANWSISRNSNDSIPVPDDLLPAEGTVKFAAGQVTAVIPIDIVADDLPEEAEAFLLKLLPDTVTGNAELDEPMEVSLA